MMINSVNSFYHFNPNLVNNTTTYVLTDDELDLSRINPSVKVERVVLPPDAYVYDNPSAACARWQKYTYYRYEFYKNPIFRDLDNLLYVDSDTEFNDSIEELFIERDKPVFLMIRDTTNGLRNKKREPKYGDLHCTYYCNGGFCLLTPKLLGSETLDDMWNILNDLSIKYDFRLVDQDAVNAMLGMDKYDGLLQPLPKTYNFTLYTAPKCTAEEFRAATEYKMKHYCANAKYDKRFLNLFCKERNNYVEYV